MAFSLLCGGTAPAAAMTVDTFLAKAATLEKKGMMALFSADVGVMKTEVTAAMKGWRARSSAVRPPVCPPPKGTALGSDDILKMLRALPPAERVRLSVSDGLDRQMNERYRCRP